MDQEKCKIFACKDECHNDIQSEIVTKFHETLYFQFKTKISAMRMRYCGDVL